MGAKHPVAKHSPVVKIKAPVRRDRRQHFHYYDDMPARFMGQTKVRKPQDYYDPILKPPKIATTHQRTAFKSTYRYKKKRFQPASSSNFLGAVIHRDTGASRGPPFLVNKFIGGARFVRHRSRTA